MNSKKTKVLAIRLPAETHEQLQHIPDAIEEVRKLIIEFTQKDHTPKRECQACLQQFNLECFASFNCLNCNATKKTTNKNIIFDDSGILQLYNEKEKYKQKRLKNEQLPPVKEYCKNKLNISLSHLQQRVRKLRKC